MQKFQWEIKSPKPINNKDDLIEIILETREIENPEEFLNPSHPDNYKSMLPELSKAVEIVKTAINESRPIVIHGDYDVDGQTATAILWRTIYNDLQYKNTFPYIPNRFDEGYGLSNDSINGIIELLKEKGFTAKTDTPLLITVDCGVVSIDETEYAKSKGFQVITTDHHQPKAELPKSDAILITEKATGAGISWLFANELSNKSSEIYLGLAAIGTICDLQPLTGFNRSVVKYGLEVLNKQPPTGISALRKVAEAEKDDINTYNIGWVFGPRLNATGRLESAMDSLRLLCTDDETQALQLAQKLDQINRQRQDQTENNLNIALDQFKDDDMESIPNFIISAHETYHEGVIGLVAGKLVQRFYRPSIAISTEADSEIAKGSARSISGISIIESLRKFEHLFVNVGGHEMAAGFSIRKSKITELETELNKLDGWDESIFKRKLTIDAELSPNLISKNALATIDELKPFGVGNPEPTFLSSGFKVINISTFGKQNNHLKLYLETPTGAKITGLAFGEGETGEQLEFGQEITVVYNLSLNTWNGNSNLELKIKDIAAIKNST